MEIKISIDQAFTNAVLSLAQALSTSGLSKVTEEQVRQEPAVHQQAPVQQEQPAVQQQPTVQSVPIQQQTAVQQQPPVQQAQPDAVPTVEQTYTMDQLARASSQLMDAGKQTELVQLLGQFGVQALTALPQEQYGAFATKLREMGAKI
ncbi:hypothetical protein [Pontibacillus litoralis]|uniref:Uncharacterized protein n=1 Tax=Pontibacillus litoralis JSM 072002 TaxID=1385512 RepID=A0A0A5G047_9BACI|nr:hypothetical protein [Pontibacillus litoralis]KGX84458.1 hypothetical protein N784_13425 [Pontibacillus litoralis JSM 072002]